MYPKSPEFDVFEQKHTYVSYKRINDTFQAILLDRVSIVIENGGNILASICNACCIDALIGRNEHRF